MARVGVGVQQRDGDGFGPGVGDQLYERSRGVVLQRAQRRRRASIRSGAAKRSSAGTSGAGEASHSRYRCGRAWRASSITSVKPSVAISAVRAVCPSSRALVVTVMPCAKRRTSAALRTGSLEHELHRVEHATRLLPGRRRDLGRVHGRVLADEHGVGEGAADIDSEKHVSEPIATRYAAASSRSSVSARCWCEGQ